VTNPPRVLCLGEILFDLLADRPGKSLAEVESWTPYPGGALANVASALVKLGTPTAFIGCIGRDEPGTQLLELLKSIGVDTTGVQIHPTASTRKVYVLLSESGDRSFAGFGGLEPDQFADAYLVGSKLPEQLFLEAEYLVLGTLELAYPETRAAVFRALQLAEQYNLKVVLDINWRPMFWRDVNEAVPLIKQLWQHIDFLKLTDEEAQWLFNTTDAGAISYQLDTVEGVLVTRGADEVSYCLTDNEGKVTPPSVKVQDTTGAGDAFLAGFLHQLCLHGIAKLSNPKFAKDIVFYSCAVGGLTTTKPGAIAAQPNATEVEAFLYSNTNKL
jgi:fructokinase